MKVEEWARSLVLDNSSIEEGSVPFIGLVSKIAEALQQAANDAAGKEREKMEPVYRELHDLQDFVRGVSKQCALAVESPKAIKQNGG